MADDEDSEEPTVTLGAKQAVEGAPLARVSARLMWGIEKSAIIDREGETVIRTPDGPQELTDLLGAVDQTYFATRQEFEAAIEDVLGDGPVPAESAEEEAETEEADQETDSDDEASETDGADEQDAAEDGEADEVAEADDADDAEEADEAAEVDEDESEADNAGDEAKSAEADADEDSNGETDETATDDDTEEAEE